MFSITIKSRLFSKVAIELLTHSFDEKALLYLRNKTKFETKDLNYFYIFRFLILNKFE